MVATAWANRSASASVGATGLRVRRRLGAAVPGLGAVRRRQARPARRRVAGRPVAEGGDGAQGQAHDEQDRTRESERRANGAAGPRRGRRGGSRCRLTAASAGARSPRARGGPGRAARRRRRAARCRRRSRSGRRCRWGSSRRRERARGASLRVHRVGEDARGAYRRAVRRPRQPSPDGARARMPPAIDEGGTRGGPGRDRHLRGLGVLLPARGRPGGEDRHPVRPAVGFVLPRDRRGPPGRVPAAPRPPPHDPAPQGQLPGQRVGDAIPGRQGRHQPLRRGLAPAPRGARALRRRGPVRGPHERSRGHLLRRPDRVARLLRRDLRPHVARHRPRRDPRARHHRPRRRHRGRDQRPALLHQGRRASGSATPGGRSST